MITVTISINGQPIFTRSAVNMERAGHEGVSRYKVDDGDTLFHDPEHGAVVLAMRMLATIREQDIDRAADRLERIIDKAVKEKSREICDTE